MSPNPPHKKLLSIYRLTMSPNENEAKSAADKLRAELDRHKLSLETLLSFDPTSRIIPFTTGAQCDLLLALISKINGSALKDIQVNFSAHSVTVNLNDMQYETLMGMFKATVARVDAAVQQTINNATGNLKHISTNSFCGFGSNLHAYVSFEVAPSKSRVPVQHHTFQSASRLQGRV